MFVLIVLLTVTTDLFVVSMINLFIIAHVRRGIMAWSSALNVTFYHVFFKNVYVVSLALSFGLNLNAIETVCLYVIY